jgi:hypothetical protein
LGRLQVGLEMRTNPLSMGFHDFGRIDTWVQEVPKFFDQLSVPAIRVGSSLLHTSATKPSRPPTPPPLPILSPSSGRKPATRLPEATGTHPSRDMAIGMLYRNCSSAAEKSEKRLHHYKKATSAYMCALALIEGNKSWKWWSLKAVVGATSFSTTRKRSSHDELEDLPKSKKIATKTLQQEYRPVDVPANHVSKPYWSPSVVDKRQVTGVLLMSSSGRWK